MCAYSYTKLVIKKLNLSSKERYLKKFVKLINLTIHNITH